MVVNTDMMVMMKMVARGERIASAKFLFYLHNQQPLWRDKGANLFMIE